MKNRFLSIFVGIFVAVVLAFGGVLGLIAGIRSARAVVKYERVTVEEGGIKYLSAYYKMLYLKELNTAGIPARDTDAFWQSAAEDGKSYAEHFETSLRDYIASLVSAANIYLSYSKYTAEDKLNVALTCEEILQFKADGSVETFNALSEKYGFNYDDFLDVAALIYKATRAEEIIFGTDGSNLAGVPEECEKYLAEYSHVSLLFVRDKTVFVTDEDGKLVYDEQGNVKLRDMTAEEKGERLALTAEIDSKIADGSITPSEFASYLERSNGDPEMYEKGYYFHSSAEATAEFAEEFSAVVDKAMKMQIGEYQKVECSIGVCFIYKYNVEEGAYSDSDNPFFSDFYKDASRYLYAEMLNTLSADVKFKPSYDEIDVRSIPKIENLYIKEFKTAKK